MKYTRPICLLLILISLVFECRKKESGPKEQVEVSLEQGLKSVQADSHGQEVSLPPSSPATLHLRILYVYGTDLSVAQSFISLLEESGFSVSLIRISRLTETQLVPYDLIIVGNDTGQLTHWGDTQSVAAIERSGKPIVGLGEGGYALFGEFRLSTGHGNGWHGNVNALYVVDPSSSLFITPRKIVVPQDRLLQLYTKTEHVGIYLASVPENVITLGREVNNHSHYPLTLEQNKYFLWGFTGSAAEMTEMGRDLFVNAVTWTTNRNRVVRVPADCTGADTEVYAALPCGTVEVPNGVIASVTNNNKSIIVGPVPRTAELPVGEYRINSWKIERRDKEGNRWSLKGDNIGNKALFHILEGKTIKLSIGEPIISSITTSKVNSTYRLRHLLKGQLGENINITKNGGRPEAPKLKISSSDSTYQETLKFAYG